MSSSAKDPRESPREVHHPDGRIEHPSVRRELTDVASGRAAAVFVVGFGVCVVLAALVWVLFLWNERHQQIVKSSTYPLAPAPSLKLPPEPRLDPLNRVAGNEQADVFEHEQAKERLIHTLGPAEEKGYVRIPIEEAMKLVVPRLPVRKSSPTESPDKSDGLRDGGGPNSGRVFEEMPP